MPSHFPKALTNQAPKAAMSPMARLKKVERETIAQTILEVGNNLAEASRILGISRATLYNKIKHYQLTIKRQGV